MFDIGFWELMLIAGVALMVLGPERLPKAASTVGRWVGQARTLARGLQAQVREELAREEQKLREGLDPEENEGSKKAAAPPDGEAPRHAGGAESKRGGTRRQGRYADLPSH